MSEEVAYARICAGVHWLRLKNRDAYSSVMREVKIAGGDVKAWNAEVVQAAENGLIVTPDMEPIWM